MRNTLLSAVSNGTTRLAIAALALCAPMLTAATPVAVRPAAVAAPAKPAEPVPYTSASRGELACWLVLSIGTGGVVLLSRRRRRVTTA